MKKVLIIAYYWPPVGGSGVQRWLKFTKYLCRMGYEVTVYTPLNPSDVLIDETLLADVPSSVTVLREPIFEPNNLYKRFLGRKSDSGNNVTYLHAGKKSFKERLGLWVRANLFIPDPKILWKHHSVRFLTSYMAEHPQDVIISTGPPHSMHLIAKAVARRTGTRWVADFRDPWTGIHNFEYLPLSRFAHWLHRRQEQSVFEAADELIQVTPKYCADIVAAVPSKAAHVHYISNGFDDDDYPAEVPAASAPTPTPTPTLGPTSGPTASPTTAPGPVVQPGRPALDDRFTLTVTGMFRVDSVYKDFLAAVSLLASRSPQFRSQYLIKILGRCDQAILSEMDSLGLSYEYQGYRPHAEAVSAQLSAHVLFLPMFHSDADSGLPFLGRVFEYLASGRPILSTVSSRSSVAKLLAGNGHGRTFEEGDVEGLAQEIQNIFEHGFKTLSRASVGEFSRAALTERLAREVL